MGRRAFKRPQAQRGLAMVEMVITLPLLLLLMFAIGEFGRLLFQYNSLTQACRDAGRFVAGQAWDATLGTVNITNNPNNPTLESQTKSVAVFGTPTNPNNNLPAAPGLTTDMVFVTANGNDHVQVSIIYTFTPVIGSALPAFFGNAVPLGITLTSTVVMRAL
jgi:Flp pilus assembly protein TadG